MDPRIRLQHEVDSALVVVLWVLGTWSRVERLHTLVRLPERPLRLEACDEVERVVATTCVLLACPGSHVVELTQRNPDGRNHERYDATKLRWGDANNGVAAPVQHDRATNDSAVAAERA